MKFIKLSFSKFCLREHITIKAHFNGIPSFAQNRFVELINIVFKLYLNLK